MSVTNNNTIGSTPADQPLQVPFPLTLEEFQRALDLSDQTFKLRLAEFTQRLEKLEAQRPRERPLAELIPDERRVQYDQIQEKLKVALQHARDTNDATAARKALIASAEEVHKISNVPQDARAIVHVEKRYLILGGLGVAALGAGAAVGVAAVAGNRQLRKAGVTRQDLRNWLDNPLEKHMKK
jgi:hypothetical protein